MDQIIKLNCPNCGGKLNTNIFSNTIVCEYCGQNSLVNGIAGLINSQSMCPLCHDKDMIQKVSAIILTQDPIIQHIRPPEKPRVPTFEEYLVNNKGNNVELVKPELKNKKKNTIILIGLGILFFFQFFILIASSDPGQNVGLSLFSLFLAIILIFFGYKAMRFNKLEYPVIQEQFTKEIELYEENKVMQGEKSRIAYEKMAKRWMEKWTLAAKRWELLYYCKRDGILFIPGGNHYVPVKDILKYLYSEEM